MSDPNPRDAIAALDWALKKAEDEPNNVQVNLIYKPALRQMREKAIRDERRGTIP